MSTKNVSIQRNKYQIAFRKRESINWASKLSIPIVSVILALVFCAIFIAIMGFNPIQAYQKMLIGGFGNFKKIGDTIVKAIPLMLCGLSVAVAFKMLLMNIGAEGQFAMGALATVGVGLYCNFIPQNLLLPAMILAGFVAGGIWAIIAVLPKAYLGVSEIIITLMFNYIALLLMDFFIYGPWNDPNGNNMPFTAKIPEVAMLPDIAGTNIHYGIVLAIAAAIIFYILFNKTTWGFQLSVIGESAKSANYAGMSIRRNILIAMLISGGLSGLAGVVEVAGVVSKLQPGMTNNYGYTAIIIAYLSKFNPLVIIIVSILFGGLQIGGFAVQIMGVPVQLVTMMQGAILFFVLGGEIFTRYKLIVIRKEGHSYAK